MDIIVPCLFFIVVVLSSVIGNRYWAYRDRETQIASWQNLAVAKKLTFTPEKWLLFNSSSASVQGDYKDCHLTLKTVQKSQGTSSITYTQILIRPEQRVTGEVKSDKFPLGQQLAYHDLKTLLKEQPPLHAHHKLPLKIEEGGLSFVYEERDVITANSFLERLFDFLTDLTYTYPEVMALGGDAVPALEQMASDSSEELQAVAQQLLRDIAADTQRLRWHGDRLFCPRCLTCCASHELSSGWWRSLTFYGCRTCRQSREFLQGPLIAVLDSQVETESAKQSNNPRVNWLQRRSLFDFSQVEIIQATDEDVERFAVQIGNDTDELRRSNYSQLPCIVSAQCPLSENTLWVLRQVLNNVTIKTSSDPSN